MTHHLISKFGTWLRQKRNFMLFSVLGVGIPSAAVLIKSTSDLRSDGLWIVCVVSICVLASLLWGVIMWELFRYRFPSMRRGQDQEDAS
jgi:hypothetical protein